MALADQIFRFATWIPFKAIFGIVLLTGVSIDLHLGRGSTFLNAY